MIDSVKIDYFTDLLIVHTEIIYNKYDKSIFT